jgi:hypothetical protein
LECTQSTAFFKGADHRPLGSIKILTRHSHCLIPTKFAQTLVDKNFDEILFSLTGSLLLQRDQTRKPMKLQVFASLLISLPAALSAPMDIPPSTLKRVVSSSQLGRSPSSGQFNSKGVLAFFEQLPKTKDDLHEQFLLALEDAKAQGLEGLDPEPKKVLSRLASLMTSKYPGLAEALLEHIKKDNAIGFMETVEKLLPPSRNRLSKRIPWSALIQLTGVTNLQNKEKEALCSLNFHFSKIEVTILLVIPKFLPLRDQKENVDQLSRSRLSQVSRCLSRLSGVLFGHSPQEETPSPRPSRPGPRWRHPPMDPRAISPQIL